MKTFEFLQIEQHFSNGKRNDLSITTFIIKVFFSEHVFLL